MKFAVAAAGATSGLPTVTAGDAPRAAPVPPFPPPSRGGEGGAGATVSAAMRRARGFSGVADSPLAIGAVPGAVYVDGSGGSGPDVA